MKTNFWLTMMVLLAASALAQQPTNPPPALPAVPKPAATVATPAPTAAPAKPAKKHTAKVAKATKPKAATEASKPATSEKPVFFSPGKATITGNNVNVRGKATISSEIVKRLNTGDSVTIIEQVIRDKPKAGEPTQWVKIALPGEVHVWVHASYVDATNKVVLPKRLNVRTGPGENYSVVGMLEKGAPVKEISTKGNWVEIEPPANAYGYIAAMYVKQDGTAPTVPPVVSIAAPIVEAAPTPVILSENPTVAATTTDAQSPTATATPPGATPTPAVVPAVESTPPPAEEPPPKRIIQHEGIVKGTWSIQAPTKFALVDPVSGKTVNYLYTTSTNLDLRLYKGLHIIVTGEEGLDERWKNTPIITIQRIQVVQ